VKLRQDRRQESEMNALFTAEQAHTDSLFEKHPRYETVGAFEGAMYESTGYHRPQMQCLMFTRSDEFCRVCHDAIEDIINLYSKSP